MRARLLRIARDQREDFQLLLTRYANERLLFRLASSKYASAYVLKGAALFTIWTGSPHRATRDIDLLGFGATGAAHLRALFAEVLAAPFDDGVHFDVDSLDAGPIREEQEYGGIRVEILARVTTAQVRLQVDVGFGDVITPEAVLVEVPPLLDFPPPRLRAYPRETVVAEKLEAMVQLGMANSRMKDFYDLAVLAQEFDFEGDLLARAIRATFERRKTPLPTTLPIALTETFGTEPMKKSQWSGFVRKASARDAKSLLETIGIVAAFVEAPLFAAAARALLAANWKAGGPWE